MSFDQKAAFLAGEGDQWFYRNNLSSKHEGFQNDLIISQTSSLPIPKDSSTSILEIGCGPGDRLYELNNKFGWSVYGIDPSAESIKVCNSKGIKGYVGTADTLPFPDSSFDIIIFGFCLYLCDRNDLFKIAYEADRCLKPSSWLSILDFWSGHHIKNEYHHLVGIHSYKMNYPAMFSWHPGYVIIDHAIREHKSLSYTDDHNMWVSSTLLRRS